MVKSDVVQLTSRAPYCGRVLARLEAHQGFHSVPVDYGLANALRVLPGNVHLNLLSQMYVVFRFEKNRMTGEGWIARIDEIRSVPHLSAHDLVLAPFAPFRNTGVETPITQSGAHVLFGTRHRRLEYRSRESRNDVGYFVPQMLPSSGG
ncbi:hypothetical protein FJZ23_03145 [Candidatus Parcubacteria bacterium]|nr:hypothetical protein [Candidatus Parcubacteria bacterium]